MVILGAGLAGLSAAYHGGGIIYEKEKSIGGTCRAFFDKGYTFDLGIHVLHTKNPYVLNLLSKKKNLGLKSRRRSAWIYSYGALTKYPFQANTFGLPKDIIRECVYGFIEASEKSKCRYGNYEDWVYSAFGRGIADNFYLPYSEKFWTVKASELTTDWLGARVPRPRLKQVIAGAISLQKEEFGPNMLFQYPDSGGIQKITEALIRPDARILLGKAAVSLHPQEKLVRFSDGSYVYYDNLISTLPLPELFNIIKGVPQPVQEAVKGLRHNSVLCVNLGIGREDIGPYHWIYYPEEKISFFRIGFPKNFSGRTVPPGQSSVQAEISYSKKRPIRYRDIVDKVIRDLIKTRVLKAKDKTKLISVKDIKYAYIIYDHERLSNLRAINKFLRKYNIYTAGRYGRWEYLWMDEAILSGKNILKEVKL
jgi:protoporphyrinogen oxidase